MEIILKFFFLIFEIKKKVAPMKKEKNKEAQAQPVPLLKKPERAEDFWKWVQQYTHYIPEGPVSSNSLFLNTYKITLPSISVLNNSL